MWILILASTLRCNFEGWNNIVIRNSGRNLSLGDFIHSQQFADSNLRSGAS